MTLDQRQLFDDHLYHAEMVVGKFLAKAPQMRRIEDDLRQGALMGLWEAACIYDATTGNKFWTIAYPRVFGSMIDQMRLIFGRKKGMWSIKRDVVSLSGLMFPERVGSDNPQRCLIPEGNVTGKRDKSLELVDLRDELRNILSHVPNGVHRFIIKKYYLDGWTMKQIACKLGRCESRVSQIVSNIFQDFADKYGWDFKDVKTKFHNNSGVEHDDADVSDCADAGNRGAVDLLSGVAAGQGGAQSEAA